MFWRGFEGFGSRGLREGPWFKSCPELSGLILANELRGLLPPPNRFECSTLKWYQKKGPESNCR